jgi:hypothetical protein
MPNDDNNTFCALTTKQETNLSAYISSYVQLTSDFTLQELCKNVYDIIYAKNRNEAEALTNVSLIPKILSSGTATDEDIYIALKKNNITHNELTELQYGDFKDIEKVREFLIATKNIKKCDEPELIPYRKGKKWGYCDRDKNIIIECEYSHTYPFKEGLGRVGIGTDGWNYAFIDQ